MESIKETKPEATSPNTGTVLHLPPLDTTFLATKSSAYPIEWPQCLPDGTCFLCLR